jgi:LAO/AO transport system kinase
MGIDDAWAHVEDYETKLGASGEIAGSRAEQARSWLWTEVGDTLLERLKAHPEVRAMLTGLEAQVVQGTTTPAAAARRVLNAFLGD